MFEYSKEINKFIDFPKEKIVTVGNKPFFFCAHNQNELRLPHSEINL